MGLAQVYPLSYTRTKSSRVTAPDRSPQHQYGGPGFNVHRGCGLLIEADAGHIPVGARCEVIVILVIEGKPYAGVVKIGEP
jgi:hypothetical protein